MRLGAGAPRRPYPRQVGPIDALAIARAAIREPGLSRPRPDERVYREIKLLVDHREDLVAQRSRNQQRLRWHLHQLDPTYQVPLRRLDRATQLERVNRWLMRREQELQVRLARDLITIVRQLTGRSASSSRSFTRGRARLRRRCSSYPAARR